MNEKEREIVMSEMSEASGQRLCVWSTGNLHIQVKVGDITKQITDGICNPASSLLYMGAGAAGAIKNAGGIEIEQAAKRLALVPIGKAVATTAGTLQSKWVIHAPTMEQPGMRTTKKKVYQATLAALRCASEIGLQTIAIPGMGTGIGQVSFDDAADAMVKAIRHFALTSKSLTIILCDINEEMVKAWGKSFEDRIMSEFDKLGRLVK